MYVSWYSSRIIAYIKKSKQQDKIQEITNLSRNEAEKEFKRKNRYLDISSGFLDEFPRMIGNACFLVLELAVLHSPLLSNPIPPVWAWIIFMVSLVILRYLNKQINDRYSSKSYFRSAFKVVLYIFIVAILSACFFTKIPLIILFALVVLFHCVFIFYINIRRAEMEKEAREQTIHRKISTRSIIERLMDFFCIPGKEKAYLVWFIAIGAAGIMLYCLVIFSLSFARHIGPFPFTILAFGVLLGFGNFVTAFSVKYKVNFHFLLFVLALLFGLGETHYVRTIETGNNNFANRPPLNVYLDAWLRERSELIDSSATLILFIL